MTQTTPSPEERADLKAAALLATPGPYELFSGPDGWMIGTSDKAGRVWLNATFHAEPQSADDEANAIFAQLANPSVVFSLLTALEEAEGRTRDDHQALLDADEAFQAMKARAEKAEQQRDQQVSLIMDACDLLAERTYGNAARSPSHNARLMLEEGLQRIASPSKGEA